MIIKPQHPLLSTIKKKFFPILTVLFLVLASLPNTPRAQTRNTVFQTGEQLVYTVKYGFIHLGTLVIQTGSVAGPNLLNARLKFWTADVPMLSVKTLVESVIDTHAIAIRHFNEHTTNGDDKSWKDLTYDPSAKSMTLSDEHMTNKVVENVRQFSDALTLFFNLRAWSASGQTYGFPMRDNKTTERLVTCHFTNRQSDEDCPAFEDKEIHTRIIDGQADMGDSSPLGASGAFTVYITEDPAAIPIKIKMSIIVGSITLSLEKITRVGWQP